MLTVGETGPEWRQWVYGFPLGHQAVEGRVGVPRGTSERGGWEPILLPLTALGTQEEPPREFAPNVRVLLGETASLPHPSVDPHEVT